MRKTLKQHKSKKVHSTRPREGGNAAQDCVISCFVLTMILLTYLKKLYYPLGRNEETAGCGSVDIMLERELCRNLVSVSRYICNLREG